MVFVELPEAETLPNKEQLVNINETSVVCSGLRPGAVGVAEQEGDVVALGQPVAVMEGTSSPRTGPRGGIHEAFLSL